MADAPKANAVVGQSGGPTAVINASLVGVIEEASKHPEIQNIYGAIHAVVGMVKDDFIDLTKLSAETLELVAASSEKDPWRVHKQGAYYKKVLEHFKPYKNHPLIADPVFDNNKSRFEYTILTLPPRLAHKIHNPQPLDLTIVIPYRGGDGQIYCNHRYFWPI